MAKAVAFIALAAKAFSKNVHSPLTTTYNFPFKLMPGTGRQPVSSVANSTVIGPSGGGAPKDAEIY